MTQTDGEKGIYDMDQNKYLRRTDRCKVPGGKDDTLTRAHDASFLVLD